MGAQVRLQRGRVAGVEAVRMQVIELVGVDDGLGHRGIDVGDVDFVVAGFGQQAGDQRADLARPEDEDLVHSEAPGVREGRDSDETAAGRHIQFLLRCSDPR